MYVIRHNLTGKYVAKSGSEQSYTSRLEDARVFSTKESAQKDLCVESESIVPINQILNPNDR